jgi:hypothetical protein
MGIDYNADLGYGFLVSDEKIDQELSEGSLEIGKEFEVARAGDAYGDEMQTFVFIKDSAHGTYAFHKHKSPLKKDALVIKDDWELKLLEEAQRIGIAKPKIGWWLLCSVT